MIKLMQGDCLERMKEIEAGSVDMVLADPPYGTIGGMGKGEARYKRLTESAWDVALEPSDIFRESERVLRTNGALALFSQEPYTSRLITSAHGNLPFSYRLVWLKDHFSNSLVVNKAPVQYTEDVCLFFKEYDRGLQHPLREYARRLFDYIGALKKQVFSDMGHQGACHFMRHESMQFTICTERTYNDLVRLYQIDEMPGFIVYPELVRIDNDFRRVFNLPSSQKYKSNVLKYRKDYTGHHPTQKPVALMEDLIKTYTNEGNTVLDFTMGSGSTGVACKNLGRKFIGIELDKRYFDIAKKRIAYIYEQA